MEDQSPQKECFLSDPTLLFHPTTRRLCRTLTHAITHPGHARQGVAPQTFFISPLFAPFISSYDFFPLTSRMPVQGDQKPELQITDRKGEKGMLHCSSNAGSHRSSQQHRPGPLQSSEGKRTRRSSSLSEDGQRCHTSVGHGKRPTSLGGCSELQSSLAKRQSCWSGSGLAPTKPENSSLGSFATWT